ncbi:MAG TPA: hypothetical protein VGQ11_05930 [Candidatus Acidoferrales bacterium]|nr:hypothetical protein [Candidatus Acidoferrales bacterium]
MTIQTREVIVVRPAGLSRSRAWCSACRRETQFAMPELAAALSGVTPRTIYRWVEDEKVHFRETPAGLLLVCAESLPRRKT